MHNVKMPKKATFKPEREIVALESDEVRIALCGHASMPHHDIYTVRNMDFHLPSGQGTFVDAQTVVKVVRNAGRIRSAYLTLSCESVQNFVLRMRTKTLLKVD